MGRSPPYDDHCDLNFVFHFAYAAYGACNLLPVCVVHVLYARWNFIYSFPKCICIVCVSLIPLMNGEIWLHATLLDVSIRQKNTSMND